MFQLENIIRENVKRLKPYSSARSEFSGQAEIFLDANENPYETGYNRYPDAYQKELKKAVARLKGTAVENIFLGNGSDEAIDLLFRAFCEPGRDHIIICPPTYGMYQVSADINDVAVKKVSLSTNFELRVPEILAEADTNTKMLFICSPNNPTGNSMDKNAIIEVLENFEGIVVVDEAYIDFSKEESCLSLLEEYPNLVILQTFSKAWGLAGIRLGMCFASAEIIAIINKIKPPYNVNSITQSIALEKLQDRSTKEEQVKVLLGEREELSKQLNLLPWVEKVYPSDANFLLIKMEKPVQLYDDLKRKGIIVRNRSKVHLCEACLRITIGTPEENQVIVKALNAWTLPA